MSIDNQIIASNTTALNECELLNANNCNDCVQNLNCYWCYSARQCILFDYFSNCTSWNQISMATCSLTVLTMLYIIISIFLVSFVTCCLLCCCCCRKRGFRYKKEWQLRSNDYGEERKTDFQLKMDQIRKSLELDDGTGKFKRI